MPPMNPKNSAILGDLGFGLGDTLHQQLIDEEEERKKKKASLPTAFGDLVLGGGAAKDIFGSGM